MRMSHLQLRAVCIVAAESHVNFVMNSCDMMYCFVGRGPIYANVAFAAESCFVLYGLRPILCVMLAEGLYMRMSHLQLRAVCIVPAESHIM